MRLTPHPAAPRSTPTSHHQHPRILAIVGSGLIAAGCLAGCGHTTHEKIVVRVGQAAITEATVEHWTQIRAGGHPPQQPSKYQTAREETVAFLINTQWQLGQAQAEHITITPQEINSRLANKQKTQFPGGPDEQHEYLKATGATTADLQLEAASELANERLRQKLAATQPPISETELLDYYNHHQQQYTTPERRDVEITNTKTLASAQALKHTAETRHHFKAEKETYEITPAATHRGSDSPLAKAIQAARPNTLTGPIHQHKDYFIFTVRHIHPATQTPLTQAQPYIRQQLTTKQQQTTQTTLQTTLQHHWTPLTNCTPQYTTQTCTQHPPPNPTHTKT